MTRAAALLLALAALAVALLRPPAVLEAWLIAFLLWSGLAVGALGALAIGHLLNEAWLKPVRAPLEAAACTMPLVALMALPVLAAPEMLYPWAGATPPPMPGPRAAWLSPWGFRLRGVVALAVWVGLALLLTRPGRVRPGMAALALALLAPTATLAAQDWALSRDASWWGGLQGFVFWVESTTSALAAAALVRLARGGMPGGETGPGEALERGLLALGLTTLWLWFVQFLIVWMADLPAEAGWYLRRAEGGWLWLKLGVAVPCLLLALGLATPPRHRPWRLAAVCLLLLAGRVAHLWWMVRPDAPLALPAAWLDVMVLAGLGLAWLAGCGAALGRRAAR